MPDSPDTRTLKPNPQRKRSELKNIRIGFWTGLWTTPRIPGWAFDKGLFLLTAKYITTSKYVNSKQILRTMICCLFPYWEEGNHDGHKKGYTVVHLGDRFFTFFMAIKPGAVFSPLTLDQSVIVRPTKGKTWHH